MFHLGKRSRENLQGVHPDLVIAVATAIQRVPLDFSVIEGVRTLKRQKELVEAGASWTLKSRHLTGHAVDIAPYVSGRIRWDWPLFGILIKTLRQVSKDCNIPLEFGYDWKRHPDGPHIQLPKRWYPE